MEVGVRELKTHLSQYLARVRRGESVVVTDRGTPVARLEPLPRYDPPASVRHLVEAGKLIYKGPPPREWPKPIKLLPGEKTSLDYLREQRR